MLRLLHRHRKLFLLIILFVGLYKFYWKPARPVPSSSKALPITPPGGAPRPDASGNKFRSRVIAVGDLHGDLPHAVRVLRLAGLIDARNKWIGKRSVLVQTGDIVDRGKDTIWLYQLMDRLRTEARAAGGAVVSLLGNHEFMNALGDWRYVTKEDIATFGGADNRRRVMSTQGWIGQTWLANYSVSARVPYGLGFAQLPTVSSKTSTTSQFVTSFEPPPNPSADAFLSTATAFVHGGITPEYAAMGISQINQIGKSFLHRALAGQIPYKHLPPNTPPEEARFYGEHGPLWERSYALEDDEKVICKQIDEATKLLNVRRLVMGHTPQFQGITSRCGGKILLIDTGISSAYGGPLAALEIEYSLTRHSNSSSVWNEIEIVNALQEDKLPKRLAFMERTVNLTTSGN